MSQVRHNESVNACRSGEYSRGYRIFCADLSGLGCDKRLTVSTTIGKIRMLYFQKTTDAQLKGETGHL